VLTIYNEEAYLTSKSIFYKALKDSTIATRYFIGKSQCVPFIIKC